MVLPALWIQWGSKDLLPRRTHKDRKSLMLNQGALRKCPVGHNVVLL